MYYWIFLFGISTCMHLIRGAQPFGVCLLRFSEIKFVFVHTEKRSKPNSSQCIPNQITIWFGLVWNMRKPIIMFKNKINNSNFANVRSKVSNIKTLNTNIKYKVTNFSISSKCSTFIKERSTHPNFLKCFQCVLAQ